MLASLTSASAIGGGRPEPPTSRCCWSACWAASPTSSPSPSPTRWIQSGWAIAIVSVLLAAELVLDKVAVVDHVNDVVQTLVAPTVGGVIFAAPPPPNRPTPPPGCSGTLGRRAAGVARRHRPRHQGHRPPGSSTPPPSASAPRWSAPRGRRLPGHEPDRGVPAHPDPGRPHPARPGRPWPCSAGPAAAAGRPRSDLATRPARPGTPPGPAADGPFGGEVGAADRPGRPAEEPDRHERRRRPLARR